MLAASAGQLELNVMEPVISFALYMQMKVLTNSCNALREKCIDGIVVNAKHCEDLVMGLLGIITVLKPHFGYKPCANIAREGFLTGRRFKYHQSGILRYSDIRKGIEDRQSPHPLMQAAAANRAK